MGKVIVNESTLAAIADSIRQKAGTTEPIAVKDFATEVIDIPAGYNIPDEFFTMTGEDLVATDWSKNPARRVLQFIPTAPISTNNITSLKASFKAYPNAVLPECFSVINASDAGIDLEGAFQSSKLTELPQFASPSGTVKCKVFISPFDGLNNLENIPTDYFDNWDFSLATGYGAIRYLFNGCTKLKSIPENLWEKIDTTVSKITQYDYFYRMFYDCHELKELNNLPVLSNITTKTAGGGGSASAGGFLHDSFKGTWMLSRIKFKTDANGNALPSKVYGWALKLGDQNIGYASTNRDDMTKLVSDAESYNRLKNDPDWWSRKVEYSRYNHDSAVETINTLPDVSEVGSCFVIFVGNSGSATDGGAINTLTNEELAVAAAKGWTVSFK